MPTIPIIAGYSLTFASGYLWLVALVFLASIGITSLYYRRTNPPLGLRTRLILGLLRGAAVTALCFVFAEPLLLISKTEVRKPTVALLIDNSSSMAENRNSREQFADIERYLRNLENRVAGDALVVRYAVSDTIIADGTLDGAADATALGAGLDYLATDLENRNLQAVVLLSDGVSNYGVNPATAAKALDAPVYTLGFGSPEPLPDIRLVDVIHNPVGFADKEFEIEVVLESRGFENLQLPVAVKHGGTTLAQQSVKLLGQGRQQSLELSLMPPGEGVYTFVVSLPRQENEQSEKNNARQIQVKFRKSRIRILLAADYLNWDFKFIKQALAAKSDFEVDTYISSPRRIEGTIPFPENFAALGEYDVLILYDFGPAWLTARRQMFDAFIDRSGSGIFLLAGDRHAAGTQTEYTRELLPFQISDVAPVVILGETPLLPTQEGQIHPILKLSDDPARNADLLASLPPFSGYLRAEKPGGKALVLAAIPAAEPQSPEVPMLAVHRYRNGKVALLSAFPVWKLDFLAQSFQEVDSSFVQIMENMVLWLVARDDLERVSIIPEKPIFIAGESIELEAQVLDESYMPVADAEVEATMVSAENPADTMVIGFQPRRPGSYSATLNYIPPGNYQIRGVAKRAGLTLGEPEASFVVEPYSLEDLSQTADFDMLKRIAEVSGGEFFAAADTAQLPMFSQLPDKATTSTSELALFDYPLMLLIFVAAVCAEWYLRRRLQLL